MLISTNSSGLASVPVGASIFVDSANGNDSTGTLGRLDKPFKTVFAALAAATTAGGTGVVRVGPGLFNEGTNTLVVPPNWSLIGSGTANSAQTVAAFSTSDNAGTIIESNTASSVIQPGNYSTIADLTVVGNTTLPNDIYPIGYVGAFSGLPTQVTIRNVQTIGPSDGVVILTSGTASTTAYWKFIDCNIVSNEDLMVIGCHLTSPSLNITIDVFNCQFNSNWDGVTSGATFRGICFTDGHSGTRLVNVYNSVFNITGNSGSTQTTAVTVANCTVNLHGVTALGVTSAGANLTNFNATASTGIINIGPGCEYKPALLSASNGGIITGSQSQILATGTPTITAGAGAGSSPSVSLASGSDDFQGQISYTPGTSPTASSAQFAVTFAIAKAGSFPVLSPANAAAQALSGAGAISLSASSGTGFTVSSGTTALINGTNYLWNYRA
jgi:hypothetical protein